MRFTRHARNGMREYKLAPDDIADVISNPVSKDFDDSGKPRFTGTAKGVRVRVVLALDEPDLIVSVHKRRK